MGDDRGRMNVIVQHHVTCLTLLACNNSAAAREGGKNV